MIFPRKCGTHLFGCSCKQTFSTPTKLEAVTIKYPRTLNSVRVVEDDETGRLCL